MILNHRQSITNWKLLPNYIDKSSSVDLFLCFFFSFFKNVYLSVCVCFSVYSCLLDNRRVHTDRSFLFRCARLQKYVFVNLYFFSVLLSIFLSFASRCIEKETDPIHSYRRNPNADPTFSSHTPRQNGIAHHRGLFVNDHP